MSNNKERFFKPRARLVLQLGDQLIKNESIALLELVKNSYDADASIVEVIMENVDSSLFGKIIISDNGEGMDYKIVEDAWLELGSDYKKLKLDKNEVTKKFHRLPIGEKGIGRFGLHKLGNTVNIVSKKKGAKEIVVDINFTLFEKQKYLDKAPIYVEERTPKIFKENETGTIITISSLRNPWDRNTVRKAHRSLFNLNSPFNKVDSFIVNFTTDNPKWIEGLLKFEDIKKYSLYYFKCTLAKNEIKDFIYKFTPWESLTKVKLRKITSKDKFIRESKYLKYDVEVLDEKTGKIKKGKRDLYLDENKIGAIDFEGYIFTRAPYILTEGKVLAKEDLKNYLDENGGISIYRDKLRINEYGEKGVDWLNLDIRRVNTPGEKISNNLILASIDISRKHSGGLIEKTNREGFVDNQYFKDFSNAINYVLDLIENLRSIDKEILNEKYQSSKISEPVIDGLNRLRETVNDKVEKNSVKNQLIKTIDTIQKEYNQINEILLASAGAGLSLSIVLHEIEKITYELNLVVKKEDVPLRVLKLAKHLADLVKGYGDIIRQSKQGKEDLKKLIRGALFNVEYRMENHKIEIINDAAKYEGNAVVNCSKRLILGSLMNILDNSIYWLKHKEEQISKVEKFKKRIYINIIADETGYLKLLIADNGKGFTIPTEQMIKPFISEKPDGMGLGLHITNEIMKAHKGDLEFPQYGDYDMPTEFKSGAKIILKFKK